MPDAPQEAAPRLLVGERWMLWAVGTSAAKTYTKVLQKFIGVASSSPAHVVVATGVSGAVNFLVGLLTARARGSSLVSDRRGIVGSCLFGVSIFVTSILLFNIFRFGGDITVNTFIITLGMVPSLLLDRLLFNDPLGGRQWLGILLAVFAGYVILGTPSLAEFVKLPLWVWLSFAVMALGVVSQFVVRRFRGVEPFVQNFWGGAMILLLTALVAPFTGVANLALFSPEIIRLALLAALLGLGAVAIWVTGLMSFKGGASLSLKGLVQNGSYLVLVMIAGALFFGEALSVEKVVGVALYLAAFALTDDNTWASVSGLFQKERLTG